MTRIENILAIDLCNCALNELYKYEDNECDIEEILHLLDSIKNIVEETKDED